MFLFPLRPQLQRLLRLVLQRVHKERFIIGKGRRLCQRMMRVEDLSVELAKEKEAAQEVEKSWVTEKADLISKRDASQIRCKELEQARVADDLRADEAFNQDNKERDAVLAFVPASHNLATQKIREFLNSSKYESKIRSECDTYFDTLVLDHKDKFPDLITLFNEEKALRPDWYGDLSIEISNPLEEDNHEEQKPNRRGGGIYSRLLNHFIS
ncbi:hypothetical protein LIER_09812 [Lithospermum erythrorhizon]|uniref:Uncharacterized protein n=1 Tax=Lithospermum erythrorhizon TaxID=34254 RepID=A0AAV3PK17_LITER